MTNENDVVISKILKIHDHLSNGKKNNNNLFDDNENQRQLLPWQENTMTVYPIKRKNNDSLSDDKKI